MTSNGRRLRLLRAVRSELPFGPFLRAECRAYEPSEISVNPHGAVSVRTPQGWLGIKPDEMEWLGDPSPASVDALEADWQRDVKLDDEPEDPRTCHEIGAERCPPRE